MTGKEGYLPSYCFGWELAAAYGDHHSDRALLAGAKQGFAVCPDRPLGRTARERGYQVLEW